MGQLARKVCKVFKASKVLRDQQGQLAIQVLKGLQDLRVQLVRVDRLDHKAWWDPLALLVIQATLVRAARLDRKAL